MLLLLLLLAVILTFSSFSPGNFAYWRLNFKLCISSSSSISLCVFEHTASSQCSSWQLFAATSEICSVKFTSCAVVLLLTFQLPSKFVLLILIIFLMCTFFATVLSVPLLAEQQSNGGSNQTAVAVKLKFTCSAPLCTLFVRLKKKENKTWVLPQLELLKSNWMCSCCCCCCFELLYI